MTTFFPVEPVTLVQMLTMRAAARPDEVRFRHLGDGDEVSAAMTFADLDRAARAVAVRLAEVTRPGERALLLYAPGLEFVVAFYGCLYAGVVAVPVAPPQPNKLADSLARLASITANSGARLLLTSADIEPLLTPVLAHTKGFTQLRTVVTDQVDPVTADRYRDPGITAETVAHLQYSSGSTGEPKGVVLTHGNVLANLRLVTGKIGAGVGVAWLPTFHDMGLLSMVTYPVYSDSSVISMSPLAFVQRPARWIAAMSRFGATHTVAPNFSFALAVRRVSAPQVGKYDLAPLRVALCGAEPVRVDTMLAFAEHFGDAGFDAASLFPCYGLAEATLLVTGGPRGSGLTTVEVDPTALAKGRVEPVPSGGRRLVASGELNDAYEFVLADPDTLIPLPAGQVGEICLRGDSVGVRYWDAPEATSETFGATVPGHAGNFLRTGDLGFVHEGQLYVTGRRKDLIIIDGYNHYPSDLEATAMDSHPALRPDRCAAFQLLDHDDPELVLVAELNRDHPADAAARAEIAAAVRTAIGEHHGLRLTDVVLITPGSIPLTSSGKVRRYAVREQYRDNALSPLA